MTRDLAIAPSPDGIPERDRDAAIGRLRDLFSAGEMTLERFSEVLEQIFTSSSHADLAAALSPLPPLVRITPDAQRLTEPLVLRVADGGLHLGSGWQLAADTTVSTGVGRAHLDLTAASWDADRIDLRLETWGSIEIVVPEGVTVQIVGGSGRVRLESLAPPVPGGPLLRITTSGPAGAIRIRHPEEAHGGSLPYWRRRCTTSRRIPARWRRVRRPSPSAQGPEPS